MTICPFSYASDSLKQCHQGCALRIGNDCSFKIIAVKLNQSDNSKK